MKMTIRYIVTLVIALVGLLSQQATAQELEAKVVVNHSKIQGTNNAVFTTLQEAITEFLNSRKWSNAQYATREKIACSFNLIVNEYSDDGRFACNLMVQASRPVYNASYNTTVFNFNDNAVDFNYIEHDKLEFSDEIIDNNLTAVLAYYAYLIIGLDMDTFAPKGGTDVLNKAENVVNNAQMIGEDGWKAFGDSKNRHALVNDYMNGAMDPYRQLLYDYHRKGLDEMAQNAERGRSNITTSLALLEKCKQDKPMSVLPQLFTEIKKDELINVYSKGTSKEKEEVNRILCLVNPSLTTDWDKIMDN
ncbi:MAG: DUF4835 family protein [Bacteroidaceae bacterium]|nr:DUF4835 family protein [Bacteroidaceae bacterium]MBQ3238386.1 DUF4835 family protein [Bacteroidaceae bacterium]MBR4042904.1 DUF4835 family protein [Bacteroidaceae bacterium]